MLEKPCIYIYACIVSFSYVQHDPIRRILHVICSGETEKTEAVESPAVTSGGDLDDKPREHSVTFAPGSPAKHAEGSNDDMIGSPMCAIRSLCFAQTFITSGM